jgi:glycosyltransferase involved in cell wall biosynthesis
MRILLLASHLPYPLDNGEDLRVFHFVKNLSKRHELHFLGYGEQSAPNQASGFFKQIHLVEEENISSYTNGSRKSLIRSFSPREMYAFDLRIESRLQSILREGKFDALWIPAWRMIPYLSAAGNTPVVLDAMDDGVLEVAREIKHSSSPMDLMLNGKKLFVTYLFEKKYFSQADICIFVADRDAEIFKWVCPRTRFSVIPNGVDINYYSPLGLSEDYPSLIFEGNMGFPPSVDAALHFSQAILPLIRQEIPEIKLYLVGKNPAPEILALQKPNVWVTGYVDDVRRYLDRASVFVCPMRKGAGIKNKILQAWAMGKAVVSTTIALAGLDAHPEENIFVADTPDRFAAQVVRLLKDQCLRKAVGQRGMETVHKSYSWQQQAELLEAAMEKN